ncbi:MAG: NAD-dependent epimerase/dehydratase family protein [Usitatibacter sp.]
MTGAGGFVGRSLSTLLGGSASQVHLGEADWADQVARADYAGATVFHLAARTHDPHTRDEAAYRRDNVDKTRALAQAAAAGGARRFVFLSTIKVNGEETTGRPFTADDAPAPLDAYGRTKWEAEQIVAQTRGLEFAIVRAPLVYGSGVKGNLRALLRLADSPLPLPFGAIDNRRSFVHVDDLARLLVDCAGEPRAAGRTFLAAHPDGVSTPGLVELMRKFFDRPRRLVRVPPRLLESVASLAGQGERVRRLTRSLEIDAAETVRTLGWSAQIGLATAVEDMARAYRESIS